MKEYISSIIIGLVWCVCIANAADLARSDNFSVIGPGAQQLADRAEAFREDFIREWLGRESPQADVRTVISVKASSENTGYTLARDNAAQKFHNVFICGDGSTLNHEVVHTVLATAYPERLPTWIEEGIASQYDREELLGYRDRERTRWVRDGFPSIAALMIDHDVNYAAAESVVAYLLTKGDKQTLLCFASGGCYEADLKSLYNIRSLGQLQRDWQAWVAKEQK